ncbi:hypothetical protein GEV33_002472 [Tenebrio molitor]|uniref:Uncharacterized protein n=1 Tax=Tenebrio molitor TaxID=7067 RepID=A0A8J6HT44_TENMO|nr:hypothetical protein GEV33_002472 [Tenebrio molitor]
MSPSQLLYGRDLAYPGAWDAPGDNEPLTPASERLIEAQRHQELYIQRRFRDEDAAVVTFQPGDLVMLRVPAVTPFRPFNCKWTGPHQTEVEDKKSGHFLETYTALVVDLPWHWNEITLTDLPQH